MMVSAFLARLRRAKRAAEPPVKIWIKVFTPDGRLAAMVFQGFDQIGQRTK